VSYAITEAGAADMAHELKALDELAENIDQLASEARSCDTLCPEAKTLLDFAWYFAEKALREATGRCSAHSAGGWCACCAHYEKLRNRAERIGGLI
jgi:hypothetical protein